MLHGQIISLVLSNFSLRCSVFILLLDPPFCSAGMSCHTTLLWHITAVFSCSNIRFSHKSFLSFLSISEWREHVFCSWQQTKWYFTKKWFLKGITMQDVKTLSNYSAANKSLVVPSFFSVRSLSSQLSGFQGDMSLFSPLRYIKQNFTEKCFLKLKFTHFEKNFTSKRFRVKYSLVNYDWRQQASCALKSWWWRWWENTSG